MAINPIRPALPSTSALRTASRVAWRGTPMAEMGIQHWLKVFVSPGWMYAKSG